MATVQETVKMLDLAVQEAENMHNRDITRTVFAQLAIAHATALASGMLHDDRPIWEQ